MDLFKDIYISDSDSDGDFPRASREFRERINYNPPHYRFKEMFRMSPETFDILYNSLKIYYPHTSRRNHAVEVRSKMLNALHWLGLGNPYHGTGDMHGVSKNTVMRNTKQFVDIVVKHLFPTAVDFPGEMKEVAVNFYKLARMPCVFGCVDGSHIEIDKPKEYEQVFVNRYGTHSINSMFVCGPDYKFYYVKADMPGSAHDSRVLQMSNLFSKMESGWRPFPGAIILGDSGYFLKDWLIPSVNDYPQDDSHKKLYRSLKSTRRVIECAIGVLKEKFQCLHRLRVKPTDASRVILCCSALHNFIIDNDSENKIDLNEDGDDTLEEENKEQDNNDSDGKRRLEELLKSFN